ncbi:hypothetical protein STAS_10936 [Striga asiatica]|uniref:Uncharacterized protein n=1 Tax=Striga asiatica TaxID=4170 RepID=A0A5A7PQ10_STRAF|nr:hypothetical protein STAS_10936 [Striga asiatica]
MLKKSSIGSRRMAWNIVRLALMWARKGGAFRNRLIVSLKDVEKGMLRKLRYSSQTPRGGALIYGERELSFDETPVVHVRMSRRPLSMRFKLPKIPCIEPHVVDFDYDFEFGDDGEGYDDYDAGEDCYNAKDSSFVVESSENGVEKEEEEEGIDVKAELFIAKFYEQMKLQRQMSRLQYN